MILAGMDVSGDTHIGNHKFMGIVIGTQENILNTFKLLGREKIHMNEIRNKNEQTEILSKINFDNSQSIAFCVRIDRNPIIEKVKKMRRTKQKRIPEIKITRTYHYLLLSQIREQIESFLQKHGYALNDVTFQCDSDCRNFARDSGLHQTSEGIAHRLSDIVAWANNKDKDPDGVISLDLTKILEEKLLERIFR